MHFFPEGSAATAVPKKRNPRHSYDENLDEPAKLIEREPVDVEAERPEVENVPVENLESDEPSSPPAFEDDETGSG